ncbi:hypothetical protein J2X02_002911 [Pseudoxanthomonas japonensis]|uniref:hypothetical protein n=1 Tax=Pseudoxanthomonas japonensis TaxID=69284 RepID=UPI0028608F06|nr:hypothetical protein [Pseudoxanthomonas japonensis]MDR7070060.1 hypothetical protein [Pseudoxanthomonas japonensis]
MKECCPLSALGTGYVNQKFVRYRLSFDTTTMTKPTRICMKVLARWAITLLAAPFLVSACARGGCEISSSYPLGADEISKTSQPFESNVLEVTSPSPIDSELERCFSRAALCQGGVGSDSSISKRRIEDLTAGTNPPELVQVDGYLQRDGNQIFLTSKDSLGSERIGVFPDSCLARNGKEFCAVEAGRKLTVIGALLAHEATDGRPTRQSILVLDFLDDDRTPLPPFEW